MSDLNLKTDFPEPSEAEWKALVEKALRGAAFETLVHTTEDGIARGPLRTVADLPEALAPMGRADVPLKSGRAWHISAPVRDPDLAFANQQLLADLTGGASALRFEFSADKLTVKSAGDMKRLLDQVLTDLVPMTLAPSLENARIAKLLLGMDSLHGAHIDLGLAPLTDAQTLENILPDCPKNWRAMTLSPSAVHEQGGTPAQEIGGLAGLLVGAIKRFGVEAVQNHATMTVSVAQDSHLEIAKLRAMRRVCARVFEAFGAEPSPLPLHAVTSMRMMQSIDPWTNLLRVMSASFGAVCGGADFICARPFTDALGDATPFGYRISRNMQMMMMEESHLGHVSDPAHGSYFHERLCEDLAHSGWGIFQEIEAAGGIDAALQSGWFKNAIDAAKTARSGISAPILGVTLHPAETERAPKLRSKTPVGAST